MSNRDTALITGATGGIGKALCWEFARRGHRLILSGRDAARLEELAAQLTAAHGVQVKCIAVDLGQPKGAKELIARLIESGEQVDILVNNAGFGLGRPFVQNDPAAQQELLQVNIHAPTVLCRHFLPGMLRRGRGKILNVASIGSFVAGPNNAIYCASKAYVLSLTEALAREVAGSGVTATALCPGATRTGFAHRAGMETTFLFNLMVMTPAQVAACGYRAMMLGAPVRVPGLQNKLIVGALRLLPRCVATALSGLAQKPMQVRSSPVLRTLFWVE